MPFFRYLMATAACAVLMQASVQQLCTHAQSTAQTVAQDGQEQSQSSAATDPLEAELDELLRGNPDEEAAATVISNALNAPSDAVRWRAARAAGHLRLSGPEIVAKLRRSAADDNWVVQLHSIAALAQAGDTSDETIETLTQGALSPNARVAAAAISALRNLKVAPEKLAGTLNKVLAKDDGAVAIFAVEAMVDAGAKATPMLKACLKEPNAAYWACVAIAEIGPDASGAVPELAAFLDSHDKFEQIPAAMLALAAIGPEAKSAEAAIAAALDRWSDDHSVQISGLYALGAIGAADSKAILENRAASDDAFVAMVAAWALARTTPGDDELTKKAVERLVAGLKSDNPNLRRAAAHGLATLNIPAGMAAPYLLEAAADPAAREHVVSALASLGDKAVPHAKKALAKPEMRQLALEVLERMGDRAADATDALLACLPSADPSVRVQINNVLASIGPQAASATDELVAELDSSDARVRQSAMYALREIGQAARPASGALLAYLKKSDASSAEGRFEQLAAAWTLARIAAKDQAVVEAVLPVIRAGLASNSELERRESIAATADLGEAGTALHETLEKMAASDASAAVQAAAGAALAR